MPRQAPLEVLLDDSDAEAWEESDPEEASSSIRRLIDSSGAGRSELGQVAALAAACRRSRSTVFAAVATVSVGLLGTSVAVAAVKSALWPGRPQQPPGPAESGALQLFEAGPQCQRCPVGQCDRNLTTGECQWYPPPIDQSGAYHCKVDDCASIPHGMTGISGCWQYKVLNYFSVALENYPCLDVQDSETTAATTTTRKPATTAREEVGEAKRQDGGHRIRPAFEYEPKLQDEPGDQTTTSRGPGASAGSSAGASEEALFDFVAEDTQANRRDLRLAAYWDIGDCSLGEDDQNADWCGGLVFKPECKDHVPVNASICMSGFASLSYVSYNEDKSSAWTYVEGCSYEYLAQYSCMPVTSTTTSRTTTSTSTSSATTSTTSSSTISGTVTRTSTTSTTFTMTKTVLTTTLEAERLMLESQDTLEASLAEPGAAPAEDPLGVAWSSSSGVSDPSCSSEFLLPHAPALANDLNGVQLPDVCIRSHGPHYVQVIGDWGGILGPHGPVPANQRPEADFVDGIDDKAQLRVAAQMAERAKKRSPDYILNAGDNFYWSGLTVGCGLPTYQVVPTGQFQWAFENIYKGEGLDGKPWLGVLGNHDYGGYRFNAGWDQLIAYSWGPGGRWVMPAQYWRQVVHYPGFSVDYFFLDTNVYSAQAPGADSEHNICSDVHVTATVGCGQEGPANVAECPSWFASLWGNQIMWLDKNLGGSKADWQIIVTHFPPTWGVDYWTLLSEKHGIDLFVTGHQHDQELHASDSPGNFLAPTAWLVSGGGGGITSDAVPDREGHDDQYGFFELTLSKEVIEIQGISHGGFVRWTSFLRQRHPAPIDEDAESGHKADSDKAESHKVHPRPPSPHEMAPSPATAPPAPPVPATEHELIGVAQRK